MNTALPAWHQMSDLDKGAAIMHIQKRISEGAEYAVENYPCQYISHPHLTELSPVEASAHAAKLSGQASRLAGDDYWRLYNVALANERPEGDSA